MPTFTLAPAADDGGTCQLTEVELAPSALVRRFGPPGPGTGDAKVSGEYRFTDDAGNVFTVYDWKLTSLWEVAEGYCPEGAEPLFPTPEQFWRMETPMPLQVGGRPGTGDVAAFVEWLTRETA